MLTVLAVGVFSCALGMSFAPESVSSSEVVKASLAPRSVLASVAPSKAKAIELEPVVTQKALPNIKPPAQPVQIEALVGESEREESEALEASEPARLISVSKSSEAANEDRSASNAYVAALLDTKTLGRKTASTSQWTDEKSGNHFEFSIDKNLQSDAQSLLERYKVPWGALVAVQPQTGRLLALAGHSHVDGSGAEFALRSGFPAASLFKIVTAAAAVERKGLTGEQKIHYRGGNYTLNRWNYRPNPKRDRRSMTLADALGKSCNPAFARVALENLSKDTLQSYAELFGFNSDLPFLYNVESSDYRNAGSDFVFARTAAGFGDVTISPLHAATLMATIANGGVMMQPTVVDRITSSDKELLYEVEPRVLRHAVLPSTARQLMQMMERTVDIGTARSQFRRSTLRGVKIAGKTGTLSGKNPRGVYHWFVAAMPAENPQVAIAALVINPGNARIRATGLGRRFLESWYDSHRDSTEQRYVRKRNPAKARG